MSQQRFEIRFDEDAWQEYEALDGSLKNIVDKYLERMEFRADEIGKNLENYASTKLSGCKELKLKKYGIRIIYRVTDIHVDILKVVDVLAVEARSKDFVFNIAHKRYRPLKGLSEGSIRNFLQSRKKYIKQNDNL